MKQMPRTASIFADVIAKAIRLSDFQRAINDLPTAGAKKEAILQAHCVGLLSHEDTTLLIEAYDLAAA